MKKTYNYLLACMAIAVAFTSCRPLSKTDLGPALVATPPVVVPPPITVSATLENADYALLPDGNYAKTSLSFHNETDALGSIPTILNSKYATASDKSVVTVTYAITGAAPIALADSTFSHVAYTLINPDDYLLLPNNKFIDFSAAQILAWLPYKYPAPVDNQLAVLTFIYYEAGSTSTVTQSFLYVGGAWQKIYTISPAQYASVGKGGTNNDFSSSDAALLPNYFNVFLKADPAVAVTAKRGDIKYVSYKYFGGGTFQRVMALTFDGNNWVTGNLSATAAFTKKGNNWSAGVTALPNYSLVAADYTAISKIANIASAAAIANLAAHPNFSLTLWNDAQINNGLAAVLKTAFPVAAKDQSFDVTYVAYASTNVTVTKTFTFDGTVFKPAPATSHMLDVDDFTAIVASNIGTASQRTDVAKFGDFDSSWSAADIQSVLVLALTKAFPTPQTNVTYTAIYTAYAGGATSVSVNFTWDGSKWVKK